MKAKHWTPLLVLFLTLWARGQELSSNTLVRVSTFNQAGQFQSTISLLRPLLASPADPSDVAIVGSAWNLLGNAYEDVGDYSAAGHAFEQAAKLIKGIAGQENLYATILDNLGSVAFDTGQISASRALRLKALKLYERTGDHAGISRVSGNLALIDIKENRIRGAEAELRRAFQEFRLTAPADQEALAVLHSTSCLLAGHEGRLTDAVSAAERSVALLSTNQGPRSYLLGTAYSLLGQTHSALRQYGLARDEFENALRVLRETTGSASEAYFLTQSAYSQSLRGLGHGQEADQLSDSAARSLKALSRSRRESGSVSAASLVR